MTESNRSIWIVSAESKRTEGVVTRRSLGVAPGKREVFEASWGDRRVVVKVFYHPLRACYHCWRERRGLRRLAELGVRAPVLLFSGRTTEGHWAIVTELIEDALTARQLWDRAESLQEKQGLLCCIAAELARHHAKGVARADPHMGSFMLQDQTIFALDMMKMRFRHRPLGRRAGIRGLVHLLAHLRTSEVSLIDPATAAYARQRQWQWGPDDGHRLKTFLRAARHKAIGGRLKRSLRSSRQAVAYRDPRFKGVFARSFAEDISVSQLCGQIDELAGEGEILKDDRTCLVSRVRWKGHDVVIKRHNHKGLWHSIRHTIKGSRARRNWISAHRLGWMEIPTPRPLGYLNEHRGPVLWQSYFISQFASGSTIQKVFGDPAVPDAQKRLIHETVLAMLEEMAEHGIRHGDMKHANILYDGTDVILTDLDAMCVCRPNWLWRHRYQKDMNRYLRDLERRTDKARFIGVLNGEPPKQVAKANKA